MASVNTAAKIRKTPGKGFRSLPEEDYIGNDSRIGQLWLMTVFFPMSTNAQWGEKETSSRHFLQFMVTCEVGWDVTFGGARICLQRREATQISLCYIGARPIWAEVS